MEAHSSISSSTYLTQNSDETKGSSMKMPPSYHSSLHSIRKPHVKPWKKPIAPLPPTPPKVYKVDPRNFRDLVQKLTGAQEPLAPQAPQPRLQRVAPPPLDLATPALFDADITKASPLQLLPSPAAKTPLSALYQELMSESLDAKNKKLSSGIVATSSSLELNSSPSSHSWCGAFPLLSPGTLSSLEQATVL